MTGCRRCASRENSFRTPISNANSTTAGDWNFPSYSTTSRHAAEHGVLMISMSVPSLGWGPQIGSHSQFAPRLNGKYGLVAALQRRSGSSLTRAPEAVVPEMQMLHRLQHGSPIPGHLLVGSGRSTSRSETTAANPIRTCRNKLCCVRRRNPLAPPRVHCPTEKTAME